jgi:hypothetical protein
MLGLSAGMYGMILAGATGLQAATDSASTAERAPVADSLAQLIAGHDRLAASLEEARSQYGAAGAAYEELVAALADYEVRIATLASQVGSISQDAAGLPGSIATPRPIAVSAPAKSARRIAPAPATAPTPKPPTTTTTGAS